MTQVKLLLRVTVNLPGTVDYYDAQDRAQIMILNTLETKSAVKQVQVIRVEEVFS